MRQEGRRAVAPLKTDPRWPGLIYPKTHHHEFQQP